MWLTLMWLTLLYGSRLHMAHAYTWLTGADKGAELAAIESLIAETEAAIQVNEAANKPCPPPHLLNPPSAETGAAI